MALIVGNTPGTDTRMSEDKIKGYKHFANKLWNITRFILENGDGADLDAPLTDEDQALVSEMKALAADAARDLDEFRIYLAAEKLYHYAWHRLADEILESSKPIFQGGDEAAKASRRSALRAILRDLLVCLHPFMPFVTEEIWQSLPGESGLLMVESWPTSAR
jgi:valyl-tRNA synthetase